MPEPAGLAWSSAIVAWVAAVPLWRFTRHTITVAHEGGHAMFGVLLGQKVGGVVVTGAGGGATALPAKMPWLANVVITLAGHLGPSAVGLGGVFLLLHGHPDWLLWISLAMLAAILVKVRNVLGFATVLGTGALVYWVVQYWPPSAQLAFAYAWVWFLLIGGVRTIMNLFWATRDGSTTSDAAVLQQLTWVPDILWLAVFWLGAMAALLYGGVRLLRLDA